MLQICVFKDILIESNKLVLSLRVGEEQTMPPQNLPVWLKEYFELIIFKKWQIQEKLGTE